MPNLVRVGGVLLREPGGALARGTDCCCVDDPPCANCCITIDWASFDVNGDLAETLTNIVVTLVMPTKYSRVVCDGESVTVEIEILEPTEPQSGTPYIRWDRHWQYVSHTPTVGTGGLVFEDGLVEWGTLTPVVAEYSVTLTFDKCWADNTTQFGDIEAGLRDGDYSLIYGTSCDSVACCDPVYPCDDCCWYIAPVVADNTTGSFELNDAGDPVFWAQNVNGDRMKVTVDGTNNGVWCVGDPAVTLLIKLIPLEYTGATWYPKVSVSASDNWQQTGYTPAIGNGSVVNGPAPPMTITWGTDVGAVDYSVTMEVPCPRDADATITVSFADKYPTGADGGSVSFEWICCNAENPDFSCDGCYPTPTTSWMHCRVDISGSNTAVPADIVLFDHPGGATTPANLIDWTCFAIFENYCCVEGSPTTSGTRFVDAIFQCCAYGRACSKPDAELAFAEWASDTFGPEYSTLTCDYEVPPDVTIAQAIANTTGIAAGGGDDGYQIVYKEVAEADCPECPP